jgi:hypothetical protein
MSAEGKIQVGNTELFTVRDAMRSLNRIVDYLDEGSLDKAVLTRKGKMVAVILPVRAVAA